MEHTKEYSIVQNGQTIMKIVITEPDGEKYTDIQWDSKTGLVTAKVNDSERKPIPYVGNSLGAIKPGPFSAEGIYSIDYHYWYY